MNAATLPPPTWATIDDLMKYDGKAELIGGKVVPQMAIGIRHNVIAGEIFAELRSYCKARKSCLAFMDNVGFRVPELSSERESFSPDAAYFAGPISRDDPNFVDGPPTFAVEVRSPEDYGPQAEREIAAKRADYFEAGTKVVWDVDPEAEIVMLYVPGQPAQTFRRGERAHAEPAVPGWSMSVEDIFG